MRRQLEAGCGSINILGGVDVELSDAEFSWINAFITETVKETGIGSHQLTHAGNVHLDGIQAVAYGRIRYSDTDYAAYRASENYSSESL